MIRFEASPFINTTNNIYIKEELYNKFFDVSKLGNIKGCKPIKGFGFLESDNSYIDRLDTWLLHEKDVFFDGWTCKNLNHWQVLTNNENDITITIEPNNYTVNISHREFNFPSLPDTIDDFINDLKRIGVKLFWHNNIVEKFGYEEITSNKKIVEYYSIINKIKNNTI